MGYIYAICMSTSRFIPLFLQFTTDTVSCSTIQYGALIQLLNLVHLELKYIYIYIYYMFAIYIYIYSQYIYIYLNIYIQYISKNYDCWL